MFGLHYNGIKIEKPPEICDVEKSSLAKSWRMLSAPRVILVRSVEKKDGLTYNLKAIVSACEEDHKDVKTWLMGAV